MPETVQPNTTSRRAALCGGLSALAAGLWASRATAAAPTGADADAELVRLCAAIHANRDAVDALLEARVTVADEDRTEPALARLFGSEAAILGQAREAGAPDTARGAKAVARLALRLAGEGEVERPELLDDANWLAVDALRFFVGSQGGGI